MDANERTCVRRFKTTSGMGSDTPSLSPLISPIKMGDVVGRGTLGLVSEIVVNREGLGGEIVRLVDVEIEDEVTVGIGEEVTVGIEEEEVGGRLEDGVGVEVGELAGRLEDESGRADSTDLDESESPPQTNWQELLDKAFSTLSQT